MYNPDGSVFAGDGYSALIPGERFAANIPEVKGFVRIRNNFQDIKLPNADIQSQQILLVDSNFLTVFSFPLLAGNPHTALTQPNTIVITEDMARREFGTVDALNKILLIRNNDGFVPYTVTGVARNCPQNSSIKFEALSHLDARSPNLAEWQDHWLGGLLNTFLVLAPGADAQRVEARMGNVFEAEARAEWALATKAGLKWHPRYLIQPLTATHLSKEYPPIDGLTDASNP